MKRNGRPSRELEWDFSKEPSPEVKVMMAMLTRAMLDLDHPQSFISMEAEVWIFRDQAPKDYVFSFHNVCELTNMSKKKLRRKARRVLLARKKRIAQSSQLSLKSTSSSPSKIVSSKS